MPPLHLPPLWDSEENPTEEQVYSGYTVTSSCPADVGWKYARVMSFGREERGNLEQVRSLNEAKEMSKEMFSS